MTQGINLAAVLVANSIGVVLLLLILLTKGWNLPRRKEESRILLALILATILYCMLDPITFLVDGKPGAGNFLIIFVGNSLLYLYNLLVGAAVLSLVVRHINKKVSKIQNITVWSIMIMEIVLLIINIFTPIIFSVDENNVYHRGTGYYIFVVAALYLVGYSLVVYLSARLKDGSLRFFPVWEFLIPIVLGVTVQSLYYGLSLEPVSFALAFCGIVVCLQNEYLYLDKLTGVYNRYELDKIRDHYMRRRSHKITAIMIDMNDFKAINDNYSHNAGDEALVAMANILSTIVGNDGNVIRFAGDEFVVVIYSGDPNTPADYCERFRKAMDEYNETSGKPYKLSAAMGGSVFDLDERKDIIATIDALMYENKKEYYKTHDRRRGGWHEADLEGSA